MVQTVGRRRLRERRGGRRPGAARASAAGLLLLAGVVLVSCTDPRLQLISAGCLPGGAPPPASSTASDGSSGGVDVYLDVSRSTTNFGLATNESFYKDLIDWLLTDESSVPPKSRMFGFADNIRGIDASNLRAAARGERLACRSCGYNESRLDEVLDKIADDSSGSLSLVITDLWLQNSDRVGRPQRALQDPVERILSDGRAIGLLGAPGPYSSAVYDVPGPNGRVTIPAGAIEQRPLFVLLIGEPQDVVRYSDEIVDDVLYYSGSAAHFSLFTPTLAGPTGPAEHELEVPDERRGVRTTRRFPEGLNVNTLLRIDLRRTRNVPIDTDGQERAGFPGAVGRVVPSESQQHAPAPVYDLDTDAWKLYGSHRGVDCADVWQKIDAGRALYVVTGDSGPEIALDASFREPEDILRGDIVFIRYRLRVGSLEHGSGSTTAWLDEWSFGVTEAASLLENPKPFFPTLNAADFRDLLKGAMSRKVRNEVVAHGSLLFSVD